MADTKNFRKPCTIPAVGREKGEVIVNWESDDEITTEYVPISRTRCPTRDFPCEVALFSDDVPRELVTNWEDEQTTRLELAPTDKLRKPTEPDRQGE